MKKKAGLGWALACIILLSAASSPAAPPGDISSKESLDEANFYLSPRPNYAGSYWVIDSEDNKIVGHSPWDPVKRRWTLFNLKGQYQGFIQATIGNTETQHYKEFLWYDKDNRYKGQFVAALGGRPVNPDLPYGELGGNLNIYDRGNLPVPLPSYEVETEPLKQFFHGIETEPVERLPR